jgi:hypothetical protein
MLRGTLTLIVKRLDCLRNHSYKRTQISKVAGNARLLDILLRTTINIEKLAVPQREAIPEEDEYQ